MAIERLVVTVLLLIMGVLPARAQNDSGAPLFLIDSDTRVGSVEIRFEGTTDVDESRLRDQIALHDPGLLGRIRRGLAWLPFVSAPVPQRFDPLELQKDKVRLTRFLQRDGFPDAAIEYRVVLDTAENAVDVRFAVTAGQPRLLDSVAVVAPGQDTLAVPVRLQAAWTAFLSSVLSERGARLSEVLEVRLRGRAREWWRDHGHAFARVTSRVDTAGPAERRFAATLVLEVETGPTARVGDIVVEGNRRISDATILRELPFRSGDPFRSSRLAEGQHQLFGLDLIRFALVRVPDSQAADSTADVHVRVEEGSLRLLDGRLGYTSGEGVSTEVSWSHRDFIGAARRLTIGGQARTGLWSGEPGPNRRYGLSTTLRQPWLGSYRVSGLVSPFINYRDDLRDRSARIGFDATVVWERGALRNMSLTYGLANRRVFESRGGALSGAGNYLEFLRALDTLDVDVRSSGLQYSANWGRVDDPVAPRSGWVARLGAQVTGPAALSNVEYGRLDGRVQVFLPLRSRGALLLRAGAGRLFPRGSSVPSEGEGVQTFLRLRDGLFTAGGTRSVRGWSANLLGPKIPDISIRVVDDSVVFGAANRYVPIGGMMNWTGSAELQLGMPFVEGPHTVHLFLDAGRVWTSDTRFVDPADTTLLTLDDGTYFGTGGGIQLGTPVGPLRLSLAYKLNPGLLDLRDPAAVARALLAGTPIDALPEEQGRRWHLHLSIGRPF